MAEWVDKTKVGTHKPIGWYANGGLWFTRFLGDYREPNYHAYSVNSTVTVRDYRQVGFNAGKYPNSFWGENGRVPDSLDRYTAKYTRVTAAQVRKAELEWVDKKWAEGTAAFKKVYGSTNYDEVRNRVANGFIQKVGIINTANDNYYPDVWTWKPADVAHMSEVSNTTGSEIPIETTGTASRQQELSPRRAAAKAAGGTPEEIEMGQGITMGGLGRQVQASRARQQLRR